MGKNEGRTCVGSAVSKPGLDSLVLPVCRLRWGKPTGIHSTGGAHSTSTMADSTPTPTGEGIDKALSGTEVARLSGGARIIRYPDLADVGSWNDLVGDKGAAVLFCTDSPSNGHWIAAFNGADGAHVFDPLGVALDAERSYISAQQRGQLNETQPQFSRLLSGQPCQVSRYDFQADKPGVNTCGRWSALRLQNKDKTDSQFKQMVLEGVKSSGAPSPDAWVVTQT